MFGAWGNTDHEDSIRVIHRALDAGINFIDTADVYSRGESEEIVGKALAGGRRDAVVLATKVHGRMHDDDPNQFGNSRRWIVKEVEDGLRRLENGVDRPLPDPPPGARTDRHRRDARRAVGPRPRGQGPLHRQLDLPGPPDRRGPVGGRAARPRALRMRAAPVLDADPSDRGRRAARVRAVRDRRDPLEPLAGGGCRGGIARTATPRRTAGARACSRPATTCRSQPTRRSSRRRRRSASWRRRPGCR